MVNTNICSPRRYLIEICNYQMMETILCIDQNRILMYIFAYVERCALTLAWPMRRWLHVGSVTDSASPLVPRAIRTQR